MSITGMTTIPAEEKSHVNESERMKKKKKSLPLFSDVFDRFESWGLKRKLPWIRASVFEDAVPPVYP